MRCLESHRIGRCPDIARGVGRPYRGCPCACACVHRRGRMIVLLKCSSFALIANATHDVA